MPDVSFGRSYVFSSRSLSDRPRPSENEILKLSRPSELSIFTDNVRATTCLIASLVFPNFDPERSEGSFPFRVRSSFFFFFFVFLFFPQAPPPLFYALALLREAERPVKLMFPAVPSFVSRARLYLLLKCLL